jgi:hypothetical protein
LATGVRPGFCAIRRVWMGLIKREPAAHCNTSEECECRRACYKEIAPLRNRRARSASLIASRSCSWPALPARTCSLLRIASSAAATHSCSLSESVSTSAASYGACHSGKWKVDSEGAKYAIGQTSSHRQFCTADRYSRAAEVRSTSTIHNVSDSAA